jgi:hypothetical protein
MDNDRLHNRTRFGCVRRCTSPAEAGVVSINRWRRLGWRDCGLGGAGFVIVASFGCFVMVGGAG